MAPPAVCGATGCAALGAVCRANLYNRNPVLPIRPLAGGLYDPRLVVTCNARHSGATVDQIFTEFGTGWFGTYNRKIKPHASGIGLTGPVDVLKPSHLVWHHAPPYVWFQPVHPAQRSGKRPGQERRWDLDRNVNVKTQ